MNDTPAYVYAALSITRPGDVTFSHRPSENPDRSYVLEIHPENMVTSCIFLSQAAAEAVVDGLVALLVGGDGHAGDGPPF